MSHCCPTCGRPIREVPVVVDLDANVLVVENVPFRLDRLQAEVIGAIVAKTPGVASFDQIMAATWGQGREPPTAKSLIRTYVCRARRLMRETGWDIVAVYGEGYSLRRQIAHLPAGAGRRRREVVLER